MSIIAFAGTSQKAIYIVDENYSIHKISTPDTCDGIRSLAFIDNGIYIACSKTNEIWHYDIILKQFKKLCNCIGGYPCKIAPYNDYYIVACCDTDTVEICNKNGEQGIISFKLGSLISDIKIINNICYVICTLSCEIYALSLPELNAIYYKALDYHPNMFVEDRDELIIIGSDEKWGRVEKIDNELQIICQSETAITPVESAIYNNKILIYGMYDNVVCKHNTNSLKLSDIKRTDNVQLLKGKDEQLFFKTSKHVYLYEQKEKGRALKILPFYDEISCAAFK